MRKKSTLVQLMFMLLFILLIVGFTPTRNLLHTNAQNLAITPTYGCLAPGCTGTPSLSPSTTMASSASQVPTNALSPTLAVSVPATTSATEPCSNSPLSSTTQSPDHRRGGHHRGGFLKEFFQLFLLLIELMLKLSGGSFPCAPAATPTPSIAPTVPVVSITPATSTTPASSSGTTTNTTTGTGASSSTGASVVGTGPNSIFGGGPYANTCMPGHIYCNGHVVTGGQANTLYTCQPHGIPTATQTCKGACKVNASGNDSC